MYVEVDYVHASCWIEAGGENNTQKLIWKLWGNSIL